MIQFKTQAVGVLVWFRCCARGGQERSTKSHEASRTKLVLVTVLFLFTCACNSQNIRRSGMPAAAQTVLDTSIEDIDAGRYEKLYHEAADEWRNDTTLDESKATFQKLHDKLGKVRTRDLRSEEHTSELQSRQYLVCRLLLEKKKKTRSDPPFHSMTSRLAHENNHKVEHTNSLVIVTMPM